VSDTLMGSAYVRIEGENPNKPLVAQRKGKSDRAPMMTPAVCLVQWPGEDQWAADTQNIWLDGSLTPADIGRTFACQMFEYHGSYRDKRTGVEKPYTQYTAKELTDADTGEKIPQVRAQAAAPAGPPPRPPNAPPPPPAASRVPATSPAPQMRKDAEERNKPPVLARKRAVRMMHEDCMRIAVDLLKMFIGHKPGESVNAEAVVSLARSLVVGMCTNADAWTQYTIDAAAAIGRERDADGLGPDSSIPF